MSTWDLIKALGIVFGIFFGSSLLVVSITKRNVKS
jgi:hypothetical protein